VYVSGLVPVRLEPGCFIRKLKTFLLGAALFGFGGTCKDVASRADGGFLRLLLFGVGIVASSAGLSIIWFKWMETGEPEPISFKNL
jgi:hypothetical protein